MPGTTVQSATGADSGSWLGQQWLGLMLYPVVMSLGPDRRRTKNDDF